MPTFDLDAFNTTWQEVYLPGINEQAPLAGSPALQLLQKSTDNTDLANLEARFEIELAPSAVTGFRWEGESFPDGEAPIRAQAIYKLAKHTFKIDVTREAIKRSSGQEAAFASVLEEKTESVAKQIANDQSAHLWHAGNGVLATCTTTSASTTLNLASSTTRAQMKVFRRNQQISLGTLAATTTVSARRVIVGIDRANKTLTLDAAVTTTGSHFVFNAGSGGSTSWGSRAPVSIPQIVAGSGTLFNIDPATHPEWVSTTNATGGVLTDALVAEVIDSVRDTYQEEPDTIFARDEVVRRAELEYGTLVRYTMAEQETLKSGVQALEIHGKPVVKDNFCPDNSAYFLNTKSSAGIQMLTDGSGYTDLDEGSGQAGFRVLEDTDVLRARGVAYYNIGTKARAAHAVATGLAE
jgi:hypothetical protein